MLQGSVSSFGDYNECLEIKSQVNSIDTNGKYCLVKFSITKSTVEQAVTSTLFSLHPIADFYYPLHGLCIPSGCTKDDLEILLSQNVFTKSNTLKLEQILHCDTKESTKFDLFKLTIHQQISLLFVGLFIVLAILATIFELIGIQLLRKHSIITNTTNLLAPSQGERDLSADFIKTMVALYGVAIHSVVAVTTPIGVYVMSRLEDIHNAIRIIWIQPFINVHGLHAISFLSGITMGFSSWAYNKRKNTPSYFMQILDRWLRNAPGVLALISIEFLWPLAGSGPLHTHVAEDIIENCSTNWYQNIFFIMNYNPVAKNCANHTFWSSVDFQLFCLGLLVIAAFKKSNILGYLLFATITFIDFGLTGYYAVKHDTTHAMATYPIHVDKVVQYVDTIHNPSTNYLFTFTVGLVVGIYLTERKAPNVGMIGLIIGVILLHCGSYSTAIFNELLYSKVITKKAIPIYFVMTKIFFASAGALIMIYLAHQTSKGKSDGSKANGKEKESIKEEKEKEKLIPKVNPNDNIGHRLFMAITRLSTSLYLVNYWFIRYDFFSAYAPFETTIISFFKRFGYSVVFSEILAYLFYVILLTPLDLYRRQYVQPYFKRKID